MSGPIISEYQYIPITDEETPDWPLWVVSVKRYGGRDDHRWVVQSRHETLNADGEWVFDPYPGLVATDWEDAHCLPLATALRLAGEAQWTLTVDGQTAAAVRQRRSTRTPHSNQA